ncbi:Asp23/Gls24 family envelope stress response protein [Herbiconiux sp. CPCC 205716]|uniref:Asp23/Gls24 family envelope stress response protein n=1 Tax=Herbiconiux gentiana TaxID=2970912 RepID=A0ABT2GCH2_9MICO|nr:Asp23/Gls24 family envelope stress response protein [Herbiconiux gentiana]MCS5713908.1 Asp23/Gls24 family envelope stress response protein [Herbiconiux gentiana]
MTDITGDDRHDDILDVYGDYLDRGEQPPAELIEASAENQLAWAALLRVRDAAGSLVDLEAEAAENPLASGWVESILANVQREVRSGRSIPLTHPSPRARLTVTEAAVLGLVRAAGDSVDGVLIGRCVLDGDVEQPGAPVRVRVEASVFWGENIPDRAEALRAAIAHTLLEHTELTVESIDVTVTDVHLRRQAPVDGDGLAPADGDGIAPGDGDGIAPGDGDGSAR